MAFVSGPRQVGKTTACRRVSAPHAYLSWDDLDDRRLIARGAKAVAARVEVDLARDAPRVVVLDELHKYARWRTFLKGLYDAHRDELRLLVTGSSRLDVYRRGGDSLMGSYFLYRMHPFSVGEIARPSTPDRELRPPAVIADADWAALREHGGFPEAFVTRDRRFSTRWQSLRRSQLVREDVRDVSRIHELGQLEILAALLEERSGQSLSYSSLAREIATSVDTVRRWIDTFVALHHGFLVRPWFRNVAKSLRKEPKWYLRDWAAVSNEGARAETLVACHLLKAVHAWEDLGFGRFELRYLRDKEKREVDFAVVRDGKPWFLVEVKLRDTTLSPALAHFQRQTGAAHALQAVLELAPIRSTCFARAAPTVVPARTLLSQLP